jgi:hypothetical protein
MISVLTHSKFEFLTHGTPSIIELWSSHKAYTYKPWCTYISQSIHFIQKVIAHTTASCEQLWSKWMSNETIVSSSLKKVSSLLNCVVTFNYFTLFSNIRCLWKNVTTRLTILFVKFSLASLLANMSDTASVESRKREAHSAFLDLTW